MNFHPIIQPPGAIVLGEGATLRDAFAMAALPALIEAARAAGGVVKAAAMCGMAYSIADAMLDARAVPVEPATEQPEVTP